MNREIKFRAWDKITTKMIFTGFHVMGEVTAFGLIEQYIFENLGKAKTSLERWNDIEITQYTGVLDKNGVEIYEGDIVKGEEGVSFVKYLGHSFWIDKEFFGWEGEGLWSWSEIEVIGNIYETPQLLQP